MIKGLFAACLVTVGSAAIKCQNGDSDTSVSQLSNCDNCSASKSGSDMDYACNSASRFVDSWNTDFAGKNEICMNGKAYMQNYASKTYAETNAAIINVACEAASGFSLGGFSLGDSACDLAKKAVNERTYYFCNTNDCNKNVDAVQACSNIDIVQYDKAKETNFYNVKSSGAQALVYTVAGGALIAAQTLF